MSPFWDKAVNSGLSACTGLFMLALALIQPTPWQILMATMSLFNWNASTEEGGSIDTSGAPNSIMMTSADDGVFAPSNLDFTIAAPAAGQVSFSWASSTDDIPFEFDPFGYLLHGVFTILTDPFFLVDSGNNSFAVLADDTFGFRAKLY